MFDMLWFNLKSPTFKVLGKTVKLWNLFNRVSEDAHWWGVGLLQVGKRHLFLAHHGGVCLLFLNESQ